MLLDQAEKFKNELTILQSNRRSIEPIWQKAFELVNPGNAFITKQYNAKSIVNEKLYSTVARRALPKFIAAMQSTVTPPNQRWHRLSPPTIELREDKKIKGYLGKLTNTLFDRRYRPLAGFNKSMIKIWKSFAITGIGVMHVDHDLSKGPVYQSVNVMDFYYVLDRRDQLQKCYHKIKMQYWEAIEYIKFLKMDYKSVLSQTTINAGDKNPFHLVEFVYVIYKMDLQERKERSILIETENKKEIVYKNYWGCLIVNDDNKPKTIYEQGFYTCPYQVTRYSPLDYDVYSTSPTIDGLPDILMLQRMRKSLIEGTEKAVDPPLLSRIDSDMRILSVKSNMIIPDSLDEAGKEKLKPLNMSGNLSIGYDLESVIAQSIEDDYLIPLFMMFLDKSNMTATEINQRAMERAMLMSVNAFPIENELLENMIHRELDILYRENSFPKDMPKELQELALKDENFYSIVYEGEAQKAQELLEASGIMQTAQAEAVFGVKILKRYETLSRVGSVNNVPSELMFSSDEFSSQNMPQEQTAVGSSRDAGAVADRLESKLYGM